MVLVLAEESTIGADHAFMFQTDQICFFSMKKTMFKAHLFLYFMLHFPYLFFFRRDCYIGVTILFSKHRIVLDT